MMFNTLSKLFSILLILFISACSEKIEEAQHIVDQAIAFGNLSALDHAKAQFTFRDKQYGFDHKTGEYEYTRTQTDSLGQIVSDMLTNSGLDRRINGLVQNLSEKEKNAYTNSINSVIYFAFLPYRLNDPAVIKKYMGTKEIGENSYHKIQITFKESGGGKDHDDVFVYWFDQSDYSLDFLAYEYHTDGGGIRFREAKNSRFINDILINDYNNYMPTNKEIDVRETDDLFIRGELELLSEINLENVQIELNK